MAKSLYDLLEVSHLASPEVIKNAYRALAAKLHPDTCPNGDQDAFDRLTKAYNILSDPQRRSEYDERRLQGEESIFLGESDLLESKAPRTVKRLDGSDTWCTIDEHVRRKGAELANTDLCGLKIRDINLAGANLSGCNLDHAELVNVDLSMADLQSVTCNHATFQKIIFDDAFLDNSNFISCTFTNCSFKECQFKNISFRKSVFENNSFGENNFHNIDFQSATLHNEKMVFDFGYMYKASQYNSFTQCSFKNANLEKTVFGFDSYESLSSKVSMCNFQDANLKSSIFINSEIADSCFDNANMQNANLCNAYFLQESEFKNANLYGADFSMSLINGIDFTTSNLIDTRFHQSKCRGCRFPDGYTSGEIIIDDLHDFEKHLRLRNSERIKDPEDEMTFFWILLSLLALIILLLLSSMA